MIIRSPKTENEFQQYYNLRWRILRKPWGQPEGSEQDTDDKHCYHIMTISKKIITGVARLEFPSKDQSQLRYMAVDNAYQGQGVGRCIVEHMEQVSRKQNAHELFLNARENALGFYEKLGYQITGKSYLLFGSIQHYKMIKHLENHHHIRHRAEDYKS